MRFPVLSLLLALGLSAAAVAAPHPTGGPPFHNTTCFEAPTTVYVTIPASVSTVYITNPTTNYGVNVQPTTTITSTNTLHSTRTLTKSLSLVIWSNSGTTEGVDHPNNDFTVTEHLVYTVTEFYPVPTVASVANSASLSNDGLYQFYVHHSTTVWLGATPSTIQTDAVILTSSVHVVPVETLVQDIHLTRTSTVRIRTTIHPTSTSTLHISRTVRSASTATITAILLSGTPLSVSKPISQNTGSDFSGIGSNGWNSTTASTIVDRTVTGLTGSFTIHSSPSKQSIFINGVPSIDIYGPRPTISVSSYAAASGFHTNSPDHMDNTTSIIIPTNPSFIDALTGLTATHLSSVTLSSVSITAVSRTISPPFTNSTSQVSGVAASAQVVGSSSNSLLTGLTIAPSSSAIASMTIVPPFTNSTSQVSVVSSSLPNLTPGLLALGAICDSSSQCANGADCYAANSMLITVCGNFQASCLSDAQCAFNTCNQGFCNGPRPQPSSTPVQVILSSTASTSMVSTTPTAVCLAKGRGFGNFSLNFDDIPPLVVPATSSESIHAAPVFNPYHQFDFSDGFTVRPSPKDAYNPSSPPLFLEFTPFYSRPHAGPSNAESHLTGQISSGDHALTGCFNFNFYSGSFGCNSTVAGCDLTFSGYRYNTIEQRETLVSRQIGSVPACPAQVDCTLVPISLAQSFQNLTHVRINATVDGVPKTWWIDDLNLGWFDNSCETGNCRLKSHIRL